MNMEKYSGYVWHYFAYAKNRYPYLFKQRFLVVIIPIAFVIIILIATGFSSPGSRLFLIKVGFLERFVSFFLFSPNAQSGRARELSAQRLSEAEQLISASNLTRDKQILLRNLFQDNAAKVEQAIGTLKNNHDLAGAVTIANYYEADLRGFESVFLKLRNATDGAAEQMDSLGTSIDEELQALTKIRVDIEASFTADENNTSFQTQSRKTMEETQGIIRKTLLALAGQGKLIKAVDSESVSAALDSAQTFIDQAKNHLEAGRFGAALIFANQAYRNARAAEVFFDFVALPK